MAESAPIPAHGEDPMPARPHPELQTPIEVPATSLPPIPPPALSPIPAPALSLVPSPAPSSDPSSASRPDHLMHKNQLQEYTQRSGVPLPIYHTVNEGHQHAPQFRATVWVDGLQYTSQNKFRQRKAAEQDAAKVALDSILEKIKDEGCPNIREDAVLCKSILNEYAVKMKLEKPTYRTTQPEGLLPIFVSSLVINGVTYTGDVGRNKKEAEQLAARAAILSLLDNGESGTTLSQIIKSKNRLYVALHKVKDSQVVPSTIENSMISVDKGDGVEATMVTSHVTSSSISETNPAVLPVPPHHDFKLPNAEPSHPMILPIEFVPPMSGYPKGAGSSSAKRRRKTKAKAEPEKKLQSDNHQFLVAPLTINQGGPLLFRPMNAQ